MKKPPLRPTIAFPGGVTIHAAPVAADIKPDCRGARARRLHQMRPDLGRLDAIAEILQIRPRVASLRREQKARGPVLGGTVGPVISSPKHKSGLLTENVMRMLSAAAVVVLLTAPAYAQMSTPNINLMPELQSKSPEEKEQDAIKDRAYKDSLK